MYFETNPGPSTRFVSLSRKEFNLWKLGIGHKMWVSFFSTTFALSISRYCQYLASYVREHLSESFSCTDRSKLRGLNWAGNFQNKLNLYHYKILRYHKDTSTPNFHFYLLSPKPKVYPKCLHGVIQ